MSHSALEINVRFVCSISVGKTCWIGSALTSRRTGVEVHTTEFEFRGVFIDFFTFRRSEYIGRPGVVTSRMPEKPKMEKSVGQVSRMWYGLKHGLMATAAVMAKSKVSQPIFVA